MARDIQDYDFDFDFDEDKEPEFKSTGASELKRSVIPQQQQQQQQQGEGEVKDADDDGNDGGDDNDEEEEEEDDYEYAVPLRIPRSSPDSFKRQIQLLGLAVDRTQPFRQDFKYTYNAGIPARLNYFVQPSTVLIRGTRVYDENKPAIPSRLLNRQGDLEDVKVDYQDVRIPDPSYVFLSRDINVVNKLPRRRPRRIDFTRSLSTASNMGQYRET